MIEKIQNDIFDEWRKKRKNIIPDGIVNIKIYSKAKIKVLYLLKEVNGGKDWNLRDYLNNNASRFQTWNNIARWQYAIENFQEDNLWSKVQNVNEEFRKEQVRKIAVINLKKVPGTEKSKMAEIRKFAWNDRELLKRQISLCEPDIVVCCGTGEIVKEFKLVDNEYFKNWSKSSANIEFHLTKKNSLIISHCHPQKWTSDQEKFDPLIKTVQENY